MSTSEAIFWVTGLGGWIIIAVVVIALICVVFGYLKQAVEIVRTQGWHQLWQQIRVHVLTRKPRKKL